MRLSAAIHPVHSIVITVNLTFFNFNQPIAYGSYRKMYIFFTMMQVLNVDVYCEFIRLPLIGLIVSMQRGIYTFT